MLWTRRRSCELAIGGIDHCGWCGIEGQVELDHCGRVGRPSQATSTMKPRNPALSPSGRGFAFAHHVAHRLLHEARRRVVVTDPCSPGPGGLVLRCSVGLLVAQAALVLAARAVDTLMQQALNEGRDPHPSRPARRWFRAACAGLHLMRVEDMVADLVSPGGFHNVAADVSNLGSPLLLGDHEQRPSATPSPFPCSGAGSVPGAAHKQAGGMCRMRTAISTLFAFWPPAPPERLVVISRSFSGMSSLTSSSILGITSTQQSWSGACRWR